MLRKVLIFVATLFALNFLFSSGVRAQSDCSNRFLTLVNPVRGRERWGEKSLGPIKNQYELISDKNFPATWLLQYNVLKDKDLLNFIKTFRNNQELGIFLEVSPEFAKDSKVIYPYDAAWDDPNAIFLSGYSRLDRRKLIDSEFSLFKKEFGNYPSSVGAWWIDSYSLNYLKEKYNISAAMIVADQRTTDDYGVWGQWWGVPYYPSKANILVPTNSEDDKQDLVVIQWAQRDLSKAYKEGPLFSNFSLQANDYIRQGETTKYFSGLIAQYLDCANPLGQVTVGLETGMESLSYIKEYGNQLEVLSKIPNLKPVTMSSFYSDFKNVYPAFPEKVVLKDDKSNWILTPQKRSNKVLGDKVSYEPQVSFSDYFITDNNTFLNRILPVEAKNINLNMFWYVLTIILVIAASYKFFGLKTTLIGIIFYLASYGLVFRSTQEFGWRVFYSFEHKNIEIIKLLLLILSFSLVSFVNKMSKNKLFVWFLPLSFGLDPIIKLFRFTILSGSYLMGVATNPLHFVGLAVSKSFKFEFLSIDMPFAQAAALYKVNFVKFLGNINFAVFIYPLLHLFAAYILFLVFKRVNSKAKVFIIGLLLILFSIHVFGTFSADPVSVKPLL